MFPDLTDPDAAAFLIAAIGDRRIAPAQHAARALAMAMVSDHLISEEKLSSEDRQTAVGKMVELALETVVSL